MGVVLVSGEETKTLDFKVLKELYETARSLIHVFIAGGVGARSDKIKSSPVDFLLNSEGEVLLANKGGEYTTRETTSLRDAKCFFGELLREIKRCVEGKGVMQLF